MTPRAPSKERVEELGKKLGMAEGSERWLGEQIRLSESEANDLLAILDDYSALKAENERLKFEQVCLKNDNSALLMEFRDQRSIAQKLVLKVEEMKREQKKAEAQLAKQAPLIEAVMGAEFEQDAEGRIYVFDSYQEAAILREALKLRSEK